MLIAIMLNIQSLIGQWHSQIKIALGFYRFLMNKYSELIERCTDIIRIPLSLKILRKWMFKTRESVISLKSQDQARIGQWDSITSTDLTAWFSCAPSKCGRCDMTDCNHSGASSIFFFHSPQEPHPTRQKMPPTCRVQHIWGTEMKKRPFFQDSIMKYLNYKLLFCLKRPWSLQNTRSNDPSP